MDHHYLLEVRWSGDRGRGTAAYNAYARHFEVQAPGKPILLGSADPFFRGDADRYNPEDLLVAALSGCHMLSYLHACADEGVVVTAYRDTPRGVMAADRRVGRFLDVVLAPEVVIDDPGRLADAVALHARAHEACFIANSVNFPVRYEPTVTALP